MWLTSRRKVISLSLKTILLINDENGQYIFFLNLTFCSSMDFILSVIYHLLMLEGFFCKIYVVALLLYL